MANSILDPKGLYTHPSVFVSPEGALLRAENVQIDREGTVSSRRGFSKYGTALALAPGDMIDKFLFYLNTKLIHYGSKLAYDSDGLGTWVDYAGTFDNPDSDSRIDSVEANKNLYVCSSTGVYKIDTLTATFGLAGMPPGLSSSYTLSAGTWFTDNAQVAYRVLWGTRDANNNLILGAPSGRLVAINTTGFTQQVTLRAYIPSVINTTNFIQVYRSLITATSTTVPNDELGLVYEISPTAGDIANGYIDIVDITPESLRGATIYTAQSQEGIVNANTQPPFCRTMDFYKNCVFFGSTRSKQRKTITLLGTGATGFNTGDTIDIGSFTFTGTLATENNTGSFIVYTAGTPAENIENTSQSLIRAIIRRTGNTSFYAYYLSGYTDLPGKILIEEQGIGGSTISISSSAGQAWNPTLTVAVSTDNDDAPNRVYYSKISQPEAVPILNYLNVGAANQPIRKILALRESLIVMKDNEIYRVFGTAPGNFQVTLLDNTVSIKGTETAVVFNNRVFCFSNQGVVAVTDSGVEIMSRPIENDLLKFLSSSYDLQAYAFGVSYESDRKYVLFLPINTTDTTAKQGYVYNAFTNSWSLWKLEKTAGFVDPFLSKMYLADSVSDYIYQERKNENIFDFSEDELSVSIASYTGFDVTLVSASGIVVGDAIRQGTLWGRIVSIVSNTITIDKMVTWTVGAAFIDKSIPCLIQWKTNFGDKTGPIKRFREMKVFTRDTYFKQMTVSFVTDFDTTQESTILSPFDNASWGSLPWGTFPWGSPKIGVQTLRTYIPGKKSRGNWITIEIFMNQPYSSFGVTGIVMEADPYDVRQK